MNKKSLLEDIAKATGLPKHLVLKELTRLIGASGKDAKTANIEDLREVLSEYLQDVLLEAKAEHESLNKADIA